MEWIVIIGLYALGMGLFHLLGGLGAAGEAFQKWGAATARKRAERLQQRVSS
jgi:hypothetical protein